MLSKRSCRLLGLSDKQVLRRQWLQSGQCIRCFHLTVQRRAGGNDGGSPHNVPKRGPNRQQRAAMASEEVKMLQRDHPSPSFAEADPNTLRPPGAGQTVDPKSLGLNVGPGQMGENDIASQEGPHAQGIGSGRTADKDVPDTTRMASIGTTPRVITEESSRGAAAVFDSKAVQQPADSATRVFNVQQEAQGTSGEQGDATQLSLQYRDYSPAVLAGKGANDIIEQRINAITNAGLSQNSRDPAHLARRLMANNFVRFESQEEKAEVEELAKQIATSKQVSAWRERQGKTKVPSYRMMGIAQKIKGAVVDDLVAGKYDGQRWLQRENKFKTPTLYEIAKSTLKNGTYLRDDTERFLSKMKSLLPPAPTRSSATKRATKASAK